MFKYILALLRKIIMGKPNEDVIGILAYGSLIEDPGEDISRLVIKKVSTTTPFPVEFARVSSSRGNAPTLIPFDLGISVKAQILVLTPKTTVQVASNILYQRETRQTGRDYARPSQTDINNNTVLVESLTNFENVQTVLYTKIGCNITDLTVNYLATNAIASARGEAGRNRRDGISYLMSAKRNGIETRLSVSYEEEILRMTETASLEEAYLRCTRRQ